MLTLNNHSVLKSSQRQSTRSTDMQTEQQLSIIQWIKENFSSSYFNCRNIIRIEQLFNGVVLAEIVSNYLKQDEKEIFLNQIQIIDKIQDSQDVQIAVNNLNAVIIQTRDLFTQALRNLKNIRHLNLPQNLIEMAGFSIRFVENIQVESLIDNKNKMINFMMQVIMILPEISNYIGSPAQINAKFKPTKINNKQNILRGSMMDHKSQNLQKSRNLSTKKKNTMHTYCQNEPGEYFSNNIEEFSSIMGYSTVNYVSNGQDQMFEVGLMKNKRQQTPHDDYHMIQQPEQMYEKKNKQTQNQLLFDTKVEKLLNWMQSSFNMDVSTFLEPHILLGQLVNGIFAPNRLKDNEKPIKPTHYELGSYSVYKKALDFLTEVQRLNKNNLIKLMRQVEQGKVNQITFWSLIEDIYLMVKNKVSQPLVVGGPKPPRPSSSRKVTQKSQKLPTEYDENINIDNIKNNSVTDILRQKAEENRKPNELKDAPLYCQEVIRQTQLWLQNQMGMNHPLKKSKPQSKTTLFENPLLNGTMYAKIIQRLKIGSAKGVVTPLEKKQLKSNLEIVKNELLNRGYECARKLNIYKPTYNFYIGLLSEIKEVHQNKESNNKKLILNDRQKRQFEQLQSEIPQTEKVDLQKWLTEDFGFVFDANNGQIGLKQLKQVIEAIVNVNFLKQTTEKIRYTNYVKLFDFFRSIGFSHYSTLKIDELISENASNRKKTQNLRWIVVRDLKIVKGQQ